MGQLCLGKTEIRNSRASFWPEPGSPKQSRLRNSLPEQLQLNFGRQDTAWATAGPAWPAASCSGCWYTARVYISSSSHSQPAASKRTVAVPRQDGRGPKLRLTTRRPEISVAAPGLGGQCLRLACTGLISWRPDVVPEGLLKLHSRLLPALGSHGLHTGQGNSMPAAVKEFQSFQPELEAPCRCQGLENCPLS